MNLFGIQERPKIGAPVQGVLDQIDTQLEDSLAPSRNDDKEEIRIELKQKSGNKIVLISSPILDETDSLCGRMWTFSAV